MKLMKVTKLCIPIALLAFGSLNASAATCSTSGQSLQSLLNGGSCTVGNVLFSNFYSAYSAGIVGGGSTSPSTPNATTDVTLSFNELTSGSDTYGTTATGSNPIYQVITDYSANASVNHNQTWTGYVQFQVTDLNTGEVITQVDDAIGATIAPQPTSPASAALTKLICAGSQFANVSGAPTTTCSGATSQATATGGTFADPTAGGAVDSSLAYTTQNSNAFNGTFTGGSSLIGVYDQVNLGGGTTSGTQMASLVGNGVENDFVVGTQPAGQTPEPGSFILLGGALVGFGALRRRKKTV